MATGFESALVKPIVDGIINLYRNSKKSKLKVTAERALTEAIRELLAAPNDLKSAETRIAVAKAAGIINTDLILAEELLKKHKAPAKAVPAKKVTPAKKAAAKKASMKKTPSK